MKCECDLVGRRRAPKGLYNPVTELPFTEHEPGECKCTNDIKPFIRKGKRLNLCSICYLTNDAPTVEIIKS